MSLAFLFPYLMLNMFRMLIHPSSGACDLCVELFHGLYCSVRIEVFAFFFFFLYYRYNPLWVLAFSAIFFHSVLSLLSFLHPLIPIVWISSSTSSTHLFLGLPLILLPIGFHSNVLLGILPPSIRITCPSQATEQGKDRLEENHR